MWGQGKWRPVRELVDQMRAGWQDQLGRQVGRTGTEIGLVDKVVRLERARKFGQ